MENWRTELSAAGDLAAATLREEQARAAAERQNWQKQTEAAQRQFDQERTSLRQEAEKTGRELANLRKEKEALAAQHTETKSTHQTAAQLAKSEIDRLGAALTQARLEKETAQQQQRALQAQLERHSSEQGEF